MVVKRTLALAGPSLFLGGALFNILPSPTDPIYFSILLWLNNNTVPVWQYYALVIIGYYLLPGTWYLILTLVVTSFPSDEIMVRVEVAGIIFAIGMIIYLFFTLGNPVPFVPNGTIIAAVAASIVSVFALAAVLVWQSLDDVFD